jgi:hypothetical protein
MSIMGLFNGGSVRSAPRTSRSGPGPKTRQKLQQRSPEAMINATINRINRNQSMWEGGGGEGEYPVFNQPNPWERRHVLDDYSPGWLEAKADQPWQGSGVTAASSGNSWLANNPWFLRLMANKHGDPSQLGALEGLEDSGGNRGWLGADWDVDIGRNNFGVNATWSLGG